MSQADAAINLVRESTREPSPFSIPSKKLVMWLFIISDCVTFGAVLYGYGYLRNATPNWPAPFKFYPSVANVMLMTLVLVTSSLTMLIGVRAAQAGNKSASVRWILATITGGIIFAILHIREWIAMIGEGVRLFQNPWGAPLFGAVFFSITGLHLLHVIGGVIAITVVVIGFQRGRYNSDDVEIWGLYWHFVDIVWMFVVPLVYLLNVAR